MKDGLQVGPSTPAAQPPQQNQPDNVIYKSFHPIYGLGGQFPEFTYTSSAAGKPDSQYYQPAYSLKLTTQPAENPHDKPVVQVMYSSKSPIAVERPATKEEAQELLDAFKSERPHRAGSSDAVHQYNNAVHAIQAYIDPSSAGPTDTSHVAKGGHRSHHSDVGPHVTLPDNPGRRRHSP